MSDEPRVLLYIAADDSDEPEVAAWLERQAEDGLRIVRAVAHEKGRAALESGSVSVLVLDMALGRTSCLFLIREARAKNPLESAYILRDDSAFARAGFDRVIGKDSLAARNGGGGPAGPAIGHVAHAPDDASAFLSRVVHEVRSPLHGVHGAIDLLEESGMTPLQKDYLRMVRDAADALMCVVNDVSDRAKPRRDQTRECVFPFEPRTCLERVAAVLRPMAVAKGLDFVHRSHMGVPWRVEGDPNALREILSGLASRLIRLTNQGAVLVDMDAPDASESGATLRFCVSVEPGGHGIGAIAGYDDAASGDDVSLVRCADRAAELGGNLQTGTDESGAERHEFSVAFTALPDQLPLANIGPDALSGRNVLIVERSAINSAVYREQLANWGCRVIEASNGSEAMKVIEYEPLSGERIDIALIDFMMPGMDGAELARAIRAMPMGGEIPLVLCTSNPRAGDAATMANAGFDAYLTKPIRFECMRKVMCLLLGSGESERARFPLITQHVIAEMDRASRSVLHVSDGGSHDREVLVALQQSELPCDVAAFGDDHGAALAVRRYGAIVLDCRASMDEGAAFASRVRSVEGGEHVPLIAIVRHEDADSRPEGIDELLVEPIQLEEIRSVLFGFLGIQEPEPMNEESFDWEMGESMTDEANNNASPIDMERLEEITAGDAELRQELIEMFISDTEERFVSLESAITGEDAQQLNRTAHSIKGSCANMGAPTLQALALELESMGTEGRFESAPELFADLKNEFEVVKVFFGTL